MKIKKVIKSEYEGQYQDTVTLTMTCSKRLHLFKRTLPTFVEHCENSLLISKIILFDDGSSEDDRYEMERIVENLFPKINIDFVYFNDMPTQYRHAYIMQHWFNMVKTNFVFHLEDDWLFFNNVNLLEAIQLLKNDWNLVLVNYAQTLREFPQEYLDEYKKSEFGKNKEIIYPKNSNYWISPYIESRNIGESMFYDEVRCREGSEDFKFSYWESYLNYPPFGLQPAVMDINKLKLIGNFDLVDKLEASYGLRMYKTFYSICSTTRKCSHIGGNYNNEKSAYELNNSIR